jgi:hypothetical protein
VRFERWGYWINGVWADPAKLESAPGVYVVWCKHGAVWTVLDVRESDDVKESVLGPGHGSHWELNCSGVVAYSAIYTPDLQQSGRKEIEQHIRCQVRLPNDSDDSE